MIYALSVSKVLPASPVFDATLKETTACPCFVTELSAMIWYAVTIQIVTPGSCLTKTRIGGLFSTSCHGAAKFRRIRRLGHDF